MRIALFHNLPSGGAKRAIYEWLRRLTKAHNVDVYSLTTAEHDFCDLRPLSQKHMIYEFTPRKMFRSPFGRLNQLQYDLDLLDLDYLHRRIAAEIDAGGYDVLFANPCMFTFIPAILQHSKTYSVYYLHEPFGPGFVRHIKRSYIQEGSSRDRLNQYDPLVQHYRFHLDYIQKNSIRVTKLFLANSRFTQIQMRKGFGVESSICYLGVDVNSFKPQYHLGKQDYILSVGELSPRKGFDFIIESVGQISSETRPPLKLACNSIIQQEYRYIQALAEQWGVDLQILTNLDTQDLQSLYNRARLCVYAPVLEPFGLVPLEAMACGTPVVGVREGGIQESVIHGYTGLLVERDAKLFGSAIQQLITDPEVARQYGQNGREHIVSKWSWEHSVENLEKYLQEGFTAP